MNAVDTITHTGWLKFTKDFTKKVSSEVKKDAEFEARIPPGHVATCTESQHEIDLQAG